MDIYWYGQACFRYKGKTSTVVIDPFDPEFVGLKLPIKEMQADIVLSSHDHKDHNNTKVVTHPSGESPKVFNAPGEYEVSSVVITGVASFHDEVQGEKRGRSVVFHLLMDGLNIVHLGDLGQPELTEEQITQIGQTDVLLIPVGGVYTISAKEAAKIVSQLEPRIIIPMHYKIEGLKFDLEPLDQFLKEMGVEAATPVPKLSITKEKLPEEPQVVVLSNS